MPDITADIAEPTEAEKQQYRYWFNCIKRAEKQQPRDLWDAADARLKCKQGSGEDERGGNPDPYVNGTRLQYERLMSFLDQTEPRFKVLPSEPFITDVEAGKRADCDQAYLDYIWREKGCQVRQSQKLDSGLRRNFGATCVTFDRKKWMPGLKYLAPHKVFIDPDCDGIFEDAQWIGYWQDISLERLKAMYPELTDGELEGIKKHAGNLLAEDDQELLNENNPEENKLYTTVRLYHVFARNEAAIREMEEDTGEEAEIPGTEQAAALNLKVPKRYLQFVRGFRKPMLDWDRWPFDLDDEEFPITILGFNKPVEDIYGWTDHQQMARIDEFCDKLCHDIEEDAYWSANKKFASGPLGADLTPADVEDFLLTAKRTFLENFKDEQGNAKIGQIDVGRPNPHLADVYKVADEQRKAASALGELLSSEARDYKDVTALAARINDANTHQMVNRRLGGPQGYEMSIREDAVKLLEIAHQRVPRYSLVEMPLTLPRLEVNDEGQIVEESETITDQVSLPWSQAVAALANPQARLLKLGVDAIVGEKLAPYWQTTEEFSPQMFKLSTNIMVVPGSTRSITKEHRAAILKQLFLEILAPMYQMMGRWDLYSRFAEHLGRLTGISNMKDFLPKQEELKQFGEMQQKLRAMQAVQTQGQGAGGTTSSPAQAM